MSTAYNTDGTIGVDLDNSGISATAGFSLGRRVFGSDGTEWLYCLAGAAITQYDCVTIDENYTARPATSTLAGEGHRVGFAQTAFTSGYYGWIARGGSNIKVRAAASAVADGLVYVGNTGVSAGVVSTTSVTGRVTISGVVLVTAASAGGTTSVQIQASNPFFLNV